ncbi:hypothetical protein PPTG_23257 [Phytophthora nicotianae INRA-310]|uniref:Uncharacterized protein n=1 Tax=Phytophthora nicotianae (strain INRA-310) TaxID=761204 RepID=W2Q488_PHYN3|nr:hypothetical protein PPTG_23257 [Phytophthora nicotianae INRA-310]ETN07344.1 hypothetical protein PPTG_23257 [Phytophthora nicotianae INRA-310]
MANPVLTTSLGRDVVEFVSLVYTPETEEAGFANSKAYHCGLPEKRPF